jgi:hypothetical protein
MARQDECEGLEMPFYCEISDYRDGEYEDYYFETPCSLVETDCRFRGAYYRHHHGDYRSRHL